LLSVAEALERVLAEAEPLPSEVVAIEEAHGRVLAADIVALRTQPPDDVSAMDGYAVRAEDVATAPARLTVIGEVAAGRPFAGEIKRGEAARIFTGGVMPSGADTVVIQELATRDNDVVIVRKSSQRRRHVRVAGLDFKAGDVGLTRQRRLSDRDLALVAALNHATVPVHRRPKVAMFATGDELVPPGTTPSPGQIVYSNGFALAALARAEGAEVTDLGIVADRIEDTVTAIRRAQAASADILVTTGGASVGEYDLVQRAFAAEGMALSFWKVALRPGRPLMNGRLGAMHVLGLPGNPVSAYVCALLFLRPLLRRLAGRHDLGGTEPAVLGCDIAANDERADYMRARFVVETGRRIVTPFPVQDSSMITPLAAANCLLIRDPFAPAAKAGEPCTILKLDF
jgi:molybdopterin molybdotransferase